MKLTLLLASPAVVMFLKWSVLLAFGWLAHFALRQQHARWRVMLWRGVLCIGLLLPAMQLVPFSFVKLPLAAPAVAPAPVTPVSENASAMTDSQPVPQPRSVAKVETHAASATAAVSTAAMPRQPWPWGRIMLGVWGLGALLGTIRLFGLQRKLSSLRVSAEASSRAVQDLAGEVQNRFYLPGTVEVRLSEEVSSPFVSGLLRPIVILPKTLVDRLSPAEAEALLSHEMAHLRQNDLPWCLAWRWVAVIFWFHPLVWAVPAVHNLACEQEADRLAARVLPQNDAYPQLLARLVLLVQAMPAVETELTLNGSAKILQRLKYLERSVHRPWDWRHGLAGYALVAVLFVLTAGCEVSREYDAAGQSGQPGKAGVAPKDWVAHWSGNGHGKDATGKHNVTVPAGITYVEANVGKGFYFDGGEHRMNVADAEDLNMAEGQDFTIEAWIKPLPSPVLMKGQPSSPENPGLTDDIMTIVDKRNQPDLTRSLGYELCLYGGLLHLHMSDSIRGNGQSWGLSSGHDLRDGKFHHVVATVIRNSPTGGKLYVDGKVQLSFDPTDVPGNLYNAEPLRIGNHPDPMYHCFFKGTIGEVSIFRRALSMDEVEALYVKGGGKLAASAEPAAARAIDPVLQAKVKASHPEGLVALWSGEGNGVDAISGWPAELTDVAITPESAGKAFSFNGETSSIKIPASPALDLGAADGFTLMAWIKPSAVDGLHPLVQWSDNNCLNLAIGIRPFENGVLRGDITDRFHNHFVCSKPDVVVNGAYQHIVMTYDKGSGVGTLYINGVVVGQRQLGTELVARTKGDILFSPRDDRPGNWSTGRMYSGLMNNLELYNRALTAEEIKSVCNGEKPEETLVQPEKSDGWFEGWML